MREIKFRYVLKVYNTSRDDPAYYEWLELKVFTLSELENNGLNKWILKECEGIIVTIAKNQYTGLKDKNGMEIYEGDIMENKDPGSEGIGIVEWKKSRGGFAFRSASFHHMYAPAWEIIGNIYENPELLKEEK